MKNIFLILFCLSNFFVFGQKTDSSRVLPKNALYFEAAGNGLIGSFNYERILWQRNSWRVAGRIGFFMFPNLKKDGHNLKYFSYMLPTELLLIYGKNRHFFETGIGITYGSFDRFSESRYSRNLDGIMVDVVLSEEHSRYTTQYPFFRLGYRFQSEKGFLFRAGALLTHEPTYQILVPWLGLSFGKSF